MLLKGTYSSDTYDMFPGNGSFEDGVVMEVPLPATINFTHHSSRSPLAGAQPPSFGDLSPVTSPACQDSETFTFGPDCAHHQTILDSLSSCQHQQPNKTKKGRKSGTYIAFFSIWKELVIVIQFSYHKVYSTRAFDTW